MFLADDGYSGTNFERPSWKKIVEMIERDEVETLIVKDLSRLGREYLQVGMLTEFFSLPVSIAAELVSAGKCSEMDIVLDLWISAIFRDERVRGSQLGPVAYFRNTTGNPLVSYSELSERWGVSKAPRSAA